MSHGRTELTTVFPSGSEMLKTVLVVAEIPLQMTAAWVEAEAIGELVLPPVPITAPPVIIKVFRSQSIPASGCPLPEALTTPPLIASVPFESIPSLEAE